MPNLTIPTEHQEQKALVQWANYRLGDLQCLLFAIPNGGARNIVVATKLKAEGVRKGIPDLMLAMARKGYNGLFIEMKRIKGGQTSKEQKEIIRLLQDQGYKVVVCKGWLEAKEVLEDYLAEERTDGSRKGSGQ